MIEPLPPGPFALIVADPPWGFATYDRRQALPQRADAPQHYGTMTLDQIKALPVASVAARDCVLHLWVISSHLPQAFEIAEAWGFRYSALGQVWVKTCRGSHIPRMGMGYMFRQESEISLVFVRGKPRRLAKGVRQVIQEPAREHSRKPDVAMARMRTLTGGAALEMFGRASRPGWTVWGNERTKFDAEETGGSSHVHSTTPAETVDSPAG